MSSDLVDGRQVIATVAMRSRGYPRSPRPAIQKALRNAREVYGRDAEELPPQLQRELALQGWILPLLTSSVAPAHTEELTSVVTEWLGLLGGESSPPSIEASWAQGFKYEANVRPERVNPAMRVFLLQQAALLARTAQFWFSRVCLLHAFMLWLLGETHAREHRRETGGARSRLARRESRESREAARRVVNGWGIDLSHPFVAEAAALCELALVSGRPARHIWIDEAGVVSKLGPKAATSDDVGNSLVWISRAAGWLGLSDRARRLVGEIVVLLNLADRTDLTTVEERLRGVRIDLPYCMTSAGGRRHLRALGVEVEPGPGSVSACHDKCKLGLCPYPAPGADLCRGELSEAFCREQLRILRNARGRRAPWQERQSPRELKEFWQQMETRARS